MNLHVRRSKKWKTMQWKLMIVKHVIFTDIVRQLSMLSWPTSCMAGQCGDITDTA